MLSELHPKRKIILKAIDYFHDNKQISITKCAKMFGIHRQTLSRHLAEVDELEDRRNYKLDEEFFLDINTEEKAYWLGFLTVDGCIKSTGDISLVLADIDSEHVQKFHDTIESEHPIYNSQVKSGYSSKTISCQLTFRNKRFYDILVNEHNFIVKKTQEGQKPSNKISKDMIRHYLRGMFDGDGWIYQKRYGAEVGFAKNYDIVKFFKEQLESCTGISCKEIRPYKTIFRYRIFSKSESLKVLDFLYENSNVYLDRKYLKYCRLKTSLQKSLDD